VNHDRSPVYNQTGQEVEKLQVDEAKLGGEVRKNLLKQAMVMYHANQRQGTVRTLARGEVAGSTRKMFRQKGTGNARTGGIRNPIKKGGGHAKQKRPKDWRRFCRRRPAGCARNSAILSKIPERRCSRRRSDQARAAQDQAVAADVQGAGHRSQFLLALARPDETVENRPAIWTARR
jgi:ribosomal protein L4